MSSTSSNANSNIQLKLGGVGKSYDLKDLKNGDGPFQATVVRVSKRAGAAFVDLGVSRQKGKKYGGGKATVLGMLRFDDINDKNDHDENSSVFEEISSSECSGEEAALIEDSIRRGFEGEVEDDDEDENDLVIEEDVSDIYSIDEDGNVSFINPLTQESETIGSIDDDEGEEYEDDDDDDDDLFAGMSPEERLTAIGDMIADEENQTRVHSRDDNNNHKQSLEVGDEVDVYIQAVYPQSGRFMCTLNCNVKKMKELKQEREAQKRLERLASKLGGESGLALIQSFVDKEIEGEIKAISKAGAWYYVQPFETGLPVGIGACDLELEEPLKTGDRVMISIDGIDYRRGQMSLKVMSKL